MKRQFFLLIPGTLALWVLWQLLFYMDTVGIWQYDANFHKSNISSGRNNTAYWLLSRRGDYLLLRNPHYPDDLKLSAKVVREGKTHYVFALRKLNLGYLTCDERLDLTAQPESITGIGRLKNCESRYPTDQNSDYYAEYTMDARLVFGKNVLQ
jgi:hypothetical protein